jgi:hypothetical protein
VSVLLGKGDGGFHKRARYRTARRPAGLIVKDVNDDGERDFFARRDPERTRRCLVGQLERLGRTVTLEETAVTA